MSTETELQPSVRPSSVRRDSKRKGKSTRRAGASPPPPLALGWSLLLFEVQLSLRLWGSYAFEGAICLFRV